MVNRQEQEKRFLEWVKARDDDWWEDEARISIWDFRVMQEFFNKDLLTTLTEFEREITERIKGLQFVYEHQWFGSDDLRVCEKCGEQIKKSSPCKASPHYMCWEGLNELLVGLKKEKHTPERKEEE